MRQCAPGGPMYNACEARESSPWLRTRQAGSIDAASPLAWRLRAQVISEAWTPKTTDQNLL